MGSFEQVFGRKSSSRKEARQKMMVAIATRDAIRKKLSGDVGNSLEAYGMLREALKSCGHIFEEILVLSDEIALVLDTGSEPSVWKSAVTRLEELEDVLDNDDAISGGMLKEVYLAGKTKPGFFYARFFMYLYGEFRKRCDFLSFHQQHKPAIICAKAMAGIMNVCNDFSVPERIQNHLNIAVDYGHLGDYAAAVRSYDKGLELALNHKDDTYAYIAVCCKLSACYSATKLNVRANMDVYYREAVKEMISLCDSYDLMPDKLGAHLLKLEEEQCSKCRGREKQIRHERISKQKEALPVMNLLLALERGDAVTSGLFAEQLDDSEKERYGIASGYGSEMLSAIYQAYYNSPDREEAQTADAGDDDSEDGGLLDVSLDMFPGDMPKAYLRLMLQMQMSMEVASGHELNAEHLRKLAMELAESLYVPELCVMVEYDMAKQHYAMGNISKAEHHYVEAFKLLGRCDGSFLTQTLMPVIAVSLGRLYARTDPGKAVELVKGAMDVLSDDDAQYSRHLVDMHVILADAYDESGDDDMCSHHCISALDGLVSEAVARLPYLSKASRENFSSEVQKTLWEILPMVKPESSAELRTKAYEAILFFKGLLLSSEKVLKKAVSKDGVSELVRSLYDDTEKYEVRKRLWGTSAEDSSQEYMKYFMDSVRLSLATEELMRNHYRSIRMTFDEARSYLTDSDVVVDYYDYPVGADTQYVAFIYDKASEAPVLMRLCTESGIKGKFDAAQEVLGMTSGAVYDGNCRFSSELGQMLFGSIARQYGIEDAQTVYFIPSGTLHKINIESLTMASDASGYIGDRYAGFIRISHARSICGIREDKELKDIELYGGLDYDAEPSEASRESRGSSEIREGMKTTSLLPWGFLPFSKVEVTEIAELWNGFKATRAKVNTGDEGTSAKFFSMDGKAPSVIHIATHSFFETRHSCERLPVLRGAYQPMELTGLVLSSGNNGWILGSRYDHQGIVKASEISSMDLEGAEMVVLSACHTAEGVVRSDGVFGLQRAFKKAGAGCIVMSLWEVNDEAGAYFMKEFYLELLSEGKDRHTAFRNARTIVRQKYPDPIYWAGFIMTD